MRDRLRRLESKITSCSMCKDKTQTIRAYYPDEGEHAPEPERCPECGRELLIALRVVEEEGEGSYLDEPLPRN